MYYLVMPHPTPKYHCFNILPLRDRNDGAQKELYVVENRQGKRNNKERKRERERERERERRDGTIKYKGSHMLLNNDREISGEMRIYQCKVTRERERERERKRRER